MDLVNIEKRMTNLHQWYYLILKVLLWLSFQIFIGKQILEKHNLKFFLKNFKILNVFYKNLNIVPMICYLKIHLSITKCDKELANIGSILKID